MNIQHLKSFYTTVKLNSISKAAKELHLTQPGLSMQIQSLEKQLDSSLLIRSNKGVKLTEAGAIVFDYADSILSMHSNIERDLKNVQTQTKELLLSSCKAVGEYALPCSIYIYKQKYSDVNIDFNINNSVGVIKNLLDRTVNIGIIHGNTPPKNINTEKIASDRLVLVTSLPFLQKSINIEEFKKLPLIFREEGSGTRETINNHLKLKGVTLNDLNIIYHFNSMEAIKTSVISGKGISFIPELTIKRELKEGTLKEITVEGLEVYNEFYVAYRADNPLSTYEKQFVDFIKSSKRGFC
ncbi:LysR family transcriptional regulator [Proteinivorax tanatarense]|uniref:LysR family transcriptional regulator n=1 Tax=Proteinivorax tanatarense TaxID=1260629 RepID=A0AAU7VPK8_9FIRM